MKPLGPNKLDALATWAWTTGDLTTAIAHYQTIAREFPDFPFAYYKLGYLHLELNSWELAEREFSYELDHDMDEVHLWGALRGRIQAAEALKHQKIVDNDTQFLKSSGGTSFNAFLSLGTHYRTLGLLAQADECFKHCAQLNSKEPKFLLEYAALKIICRQPQEAQKLYIACQKVQPWTSAYRLAAIIGEGDSVRRSGFVRDAIDVLERLKREISPFLLSQKVLMDPSLDRKTLQQLYYHAIYLQAGCKLKQGLLSETVACYTIILKEFPYFDAPKLHVMQGARGPDLKLLDRSIFSAINVKIAIKLYDKMLDRYGPDACVYFHRASMHLAVGNVSSCGSDLSSSLETESAFLKRYLAQNCFEDFQDERHAFFCPLNFLQSIHDRVNEMTLEGKKLNLDCFNSVDIVYWTYRVKMDHLNRRHVEFCLIDNIRRSDSGIAHERINKALEMDQDDPYLIMQSGLIALDRLMISDAQNAFTQVFEIIQQDVAQNSEVEDDNLDTEQWKLRNLLCLVLTWRGVTWKVMGNLLKAKQDIHQALSVFPSHPIALAQKTLMLALHAPLRTVLEPLGLLMNSVRKSIAPNLFGKAGTFSYSFLPERLRDDEALLAIGNTEEALPDLHCNAVVAETVDKMYNLGLARLMKNKIEVAYRYFKYAIMLRKTYIPQTVSAMADCRDANATALVCVEKLFERAQDLYDNSNWGDQVLTDLSTVIRMCPAFIDAVWLRAMVFKRVGNWLSCIDDLTVVIEHLEATNAEGNRDRLSRAYLCRGTLYREIGKNELALDDLSVSVASAENKAVALQYRSDVLIQMQRFSEARMDLQLLAGTSRAKDQRKADEILLCNLYAHQAIQH